MRLTIGIIGLGLCATGLADCSDYTDFDQCATDCTCQRVACCCGTGCDQQGGTEQYNACVPANSAYEQWTGCPAADSCAATSGLVRTITPCLVPTPSPSAAPNSSDSDVPFGTTFPMIGTKALSHQTWQSNVYMGTTMQFNPGAFWGYTDSYNVPAWGGNGNGNGGYGGGGDNGNGGYGYDNTPTPAPTPFDATGQLCYSYSQPCPTGYYCKLDTGVGNVQQKGACAKEAKDTWTGGAGKFTDSQYYTSMTNPNLIFDPNHDGLGPDTYNSYYSANGYGYAPPLIPGEPGAETCGPLPTGAPVCGFKSFTGTCFCDTECSTKGDCCVDYAQFCGVLSNQYTGYPAPVAVAPPIYTPPVSSVPAYTPPAISNPAGANCDAVGQCAGLCGSSTPAIGVNGKPCYCDSQCAVTGDCCCSQAQCV